MRQGILFSLAIALAASSAFAVDGVVLINQSTVMAAGGFPYRITQPGSYKLAGNLTQPTDGVDAIQIQASPVVLDLNGFSITGPGASSSGTPGTCGSAILGPGQCSGIFSVWADVTVKNGSVTGFAEGVVLDTRATVSDVIANRNREGIYIFDGAIERSTADSNLVSGIGISKGRVSDCHGSYNTGPGIDAVQAIVSNSTAMYNDIGIRAQHSLIGNNILYANGSGGATDLQLSNGSVSQGNNLCTAGGC